MVKVSIGRYELWAQDIHLTSPHREPHYTIGDWLTRQGCSELDIIDFTKDPFLVNEIVIDKRVHSIIFLQLCSIIYFFSIIEPIATNVLLFEKCIHWCATPLAFNDEINSIILHLSFYLYSRKQKLLQGLKTCSSKNSHLWKGNLTLAISQYVYWCN